MDAEKSVILVKARPQSSLNSTYRLWPLNIPASFSGVHDNLPSRVMSGCKLPIWWYFYRRYQRNDNALTFLSCCFRNRESFLMDWCQIELHFNNEFNHTLDHCQTLNWVLPRSAHTHNHLAWEETYVIGSKLQCFVNKILTKEPITLKKKEFCLLKWSNPLERFMWIFYAIFRELLKFSKLETVFQVYRKGTVQFYCIFT